MVLICTTVMVFSVGSFAQQQQPYNPVQALGGLIPPIQPVGFFASISNFFSNLFGLNDDVSINFDGNGGGTVTVGGYPVGYPAGYPGAVGQSGGTGAGVYPGGNNGFAVAGPPVAYNPNGFFNTLFGNRPYGYYGNGYDDTQIRVDVNAGGYPYYGKTIWIFNTRIIDYSIQHFVNRLN